MTRGVRLYLVGSIVLVSLAGCGRGFFQAEREPWRAEAEIACLKSGAVKESADVVRIEPINGPGMCGADYPLRVAALGESFSTYGFADEDLRPPAPIGREPRWPVAQPPRAYPQNAHPQSSYPQASYPQANPETTAREPRYGAAPGAPLSLSAPGLRRDEDDINLPPEGVPASRAPIMSAPASAPPYSPPRLGPRGDPIGALGPVAVRPTATLACPIVSALDRWLAASVQPAAQRWFNSRVVEIKQISAYSCRGMNGNPHAHISEHAFGNALDIAAFTLADGRRLTVKEGWRGLPEEQGFLRDIQASACREFATVLAPGSNVYHYDHIHVDLMRRSSGRAICEPDAVSGEEIAARASRRNPYASSRDPYVTGSLGGPREARRKNRERINEEDEFEDD
jgi:Extensin-like protein C-terminus